MRHTLSHINRRLQSYHWTSSVYLRPSHIIFLWWKSGVTPSHHERLKVQEGHLHKRLEMLPPAAAAPSLFPNTLMRTTPVKARKAEPHVSLLTWLPDTADRRGTKTVMVCNMKPALVAVVLPSAYVCMWGHSKAPKCLAQISHFNSATTHKSTVEVSLFRHTIIYISVPKVWTVTCHLFIDSLVETHE